MSVDKALNYLSLARKAGLAELGEEPVAAAARDLHAALVLVAGDASDHTWRRAKSLVAGTNQLCLRLKYSKDEMGMAIGRTSLAIAAITDPALALSLIEALPEAHEAEIAALQEKVRRLRQRSSEKKAHLRNKRMGRTKAAAKKNG